jgi:phage gpG-like protein
MGKAEVSVQWDFPDYLKAFQASKHRIEQTIASTIQFQVGMRFEHEGAYNGHDHWAPLKMRQGQILSLTGTLRKSIAPPSADGKAGEDGFVTAEGPIENLLVEVGTKLIYASTHDRGATIVPRRKRALKYWNPAGQKFMFSKKSVIPKRSFTDQNEKDQQELEETLGNLISEILGMA